MMITREWTNNIRLAVKVTIDDKEVIEEICLARGETISNFLRRAIRRELYSLGYYPNGMTKEETKKALGMTT